MTQSVKTTLREALSLARGLYRLTIGKECPDDPALEFAEKDSLRVLAEIHNAASRITISRGTLEVVEQFWRNAFEDEAFAGGFGQDPSATPEGLIRHSLTWLFLHELHHFQMSQFELLEQDHIAETDGAVRLGLVEHSISP